MRFAPLLVLGFLTAGCSGGSTPYRPVPPISADLVRLELTVQVDDSEARRVERSSRGQWLRDLRAAARSTPEQRFTSPGPEILLRRLAREARTHEFHEVSVRLLRPHQLAPLIVVRTSDAESLAQAMGSILPRLDPNWTDRWDYEGIYFLAVDERGVPLFLISNVVRGGLETSEWARSEDLYPFPHW
jgi:hypothetical protein